MSNYTNPDGRNFTIPNYSDFSNGPVNFKAFAATMPSYGSEIMTISAGDAAYEQKHLSRVLWFQYGGEYTLNDSAPVGAQVSIATSGGFVSIMTDGVSAEPAQERLIRPYSIVTCTKVANGMWLVAKGSGAAGQYFNEATGGTVTEVADYNGSGELWRVHTFTSGSTFTVSTDLQPFRVLVVGGGGGGGAGGGGGGGAGGVIVDDAMALSVASHSVTIGTGGSAGQSWHEGGGGCGYGWGDSGADGTSTTFGALEAFGGGGGGGYDVNGRSGASGGGHGGDWWGTACGNTPGQAIHGAQGNDAPGGHGGGYGSNGAGLVSNISGADVEYAAGGASNRWTPIYAPPANSGHGGIGGRQDVHPGHAGAAGVVIVAYQIG